MVRSIVVRVLSVAAIIVGVGLPVAAVAATAPVDTQPTITTEIVGLRTANSRTFDTNKPGVKMTELYSQPRFARESKGGFAPIDPTLRWTGSAFEPVTTIPRETIAATSDNVELASVSTMPAATVSTPDNPIAAQATAQSVSFGLTGARRVQGKQSMTDTVQFSSVLENVDLSLQTTSGGVKETLVLTSPEAPRDYVFPLKVSGLKAATNTSGGIDFVAPGGSVIFRIPHGWMADSNRHPITGVPQQSQGVSYALKTDDAGQTQLTVHLDGSWLDDPTRKYPVSVDPTVTQVFGDADDTYITAYVTADNSSRPNLNVGYDGYLGNRAFLHFGSVSQFAGKTILNADFKMWEQAAGACTPSTFNVYRVTSSWTGSAVQSWNTQPNVAGIIGSSTDTFGKDSSCPANYSTASLTGAVQHWADGSWTNYGVALWAANEYDAAQFKQFTSNDGILQPHMSVYWSTPNSAAPAVPTSLSPAGPLTTLTPTLTAGYSDPGAVSGYATFGVYDAQTGNLVSGSAGTTVPSGGTSSWMVSPALDSTKTYLIRAFSTNTNGYSSALSAPQTVYPNFGNKPVLNNGNDAGDPTVLRAGSTYYAFTTNTGYLCPTHVPVYSSVDLQSWTAVGGGDALPNLGAWANSSALCKVWAPSVRQVGSNFVLYYVANDRATNSGKQCIGTATSSSAQGPFSPQLTSLVCPANSIDPAKPTALSTNGGAIDPEIVSYGGSLYLLWKNDGNSLNNTTYLWAKKLSSDGLSFADALAPVELLHNDQTWENGGANLNLIENPFMVTAGSSVRLFYSGNAFSSDGYSEGYANCPFGPTAACNKVTISPTPGPWLAYTNTTSQPNAINRTDQAKGPGGASFFTDANGQWWMAYHGYAGATSGSRAMYIEKVDLGPSTPTLDNHYPLYLAQPVTNIGELQSGLNSKAFGVNGSSQVVGSADWNSTPVVQHAVSWDPTNKLVDRGTYWSTAASVAYSISGGGIVAGAAGAPAADCSTANEHAVQWSLGGQNFVDLSPYGGATFTGDSCARGVNKDGTVVGVAFETGQFPNGGHWKAFRYDPNQSAILQDIMPTCTYPSCYSYAYAINGPGQIAGYELTGGATRGFRYDPSTSTTSLLGQPQTGSVDYGLAINDSGVVVGQSFESDGPHAIRWDASGVPIDVLVGSGFPFGRATAINSNGQIVGFMSTSSSMATAQGFAWSAATGLVAIPLPSGSTYCRIQSLSDNGVIAGYYTDSGGRSHGFISAAPPTY